MVTTTGDRHAAEPPGTSPERLPLTTLTITFGLTGLAGVWSLARTELGVPTLVSEVFWMVAATSWVWLIVAHTLRGQRSSARLIDQLQHPVQGPIAALVPVVAILLGAHVYGFLPLLGLWMVLIGLITALLFGGWIIGRWVTGGIEPDAVHGGYFLPTVVAGFIGATAAAKTGLHDVAVGAFAVGVFFWLVIFTMLITRLALRPALPAALLPTLAIIVAPPAVGGTAWMTITGGGMDSIDHAFAALTVLMILVQLAFVRTYLALRFTLGFWSFTFPFAAVIGYGIEWLALERPNGWQIAAWAMVASITVFILGIAVQSMRPAFRGSAPLAGPARVGTELETADDTALTPPAR